ncbi:hypothetical protein IFM89_024365 [Coptis chinensis]|uniref:Uncharacterized protein n=1 Tax=Coptis chinensis TaxID=261450 RepID=A0A835J0C8_9MAGN|nr:hypothetical protein IFM89_024365 [Coptis chinensis]
MMSPKPISEDRGVTNSSFRHTPFQIIHVFGNFMRIWSIYLMYHYLSEQGARVLFFVFSILLPSSILFLVLQKPWKGRPLSSQQVVPSLINGAITALYFILWTNGLKSCGPLRAIMAEYAGAILGVLSAVLYGRRGNIWKKGSNSDSSMTLDFPSLTYLTAVLFGVVLIFYIDSIAEERLHFVFSSPRHLMVAAGSIIVMEIVYKKDFSLLGFLICSIILGFGIFEATSLERIGKDLQRANDGTFENQNNFLPVQT